MVLLVEHSHDGGDNGSDDAVVVSGTIRLHQNKLVYLATVQIVRVEGIVRALIGFRFYHCYHWSCDPPGGLHCMIVDLWHSLPLK
jgi:hypothetical protein